MRKSNFNETQIVGILKESEGGVPVAPSCASSLRIGFGSTTASGLTTALAGCRRSLSCQGVPQAERLLCSVNLTGKLTVTQSNAAAFDRCQLHI